MKLEASHRYRYRHVVAVLDARTFALRQSSFQKNLKNSASQLLSHHPVVLVDDASKLDVTARLSRQHVRW